MRTGEGFKLKVERLRRGIRQYEIADQLAVSPTVVCEWESGRRPIPPERAAEFQRAIDDLTPQSKAHELNGRAA